MKLISNQNIHSIRMKSYTFNDTNSIDRMPLKNLNHPSTQWENLLVLVISTCITNRFNALDSRNIQYLFRSLATRMISEHLQVRRDVDRIVFVWWYYNAPLEFNIYIYIYCQWNIIIERFYLLEISLEEIFSGNYLTEESSSFRSSQFEWGALRVRRESFGMSSWNLFPRTGYWASKSW